MLITTKRRRSYASKPKPAKREPSFDWRGTLHPASGWACYAGHLVDDHGWRILLSGQAVTFDATRPAILVSGTVQRIGWGAAPWEDRNWRLALLAGPALEGVLGMEAGALRLWLRLGVDEQALAMPVALDGEGGFLLGSHDAALSGRKSAGSVTAA